MTIDPPIFDSCCLSVYNLAKYFIFVNRKIGEFPQKSHPGSPPNGRRKKEAYYIFPAELRRKREGDGAGDRRTPLRSKT
jgi:hypothetical protein